MVLSKMLAGIDLRRWSPRSKAPATYDGAHSIALLHSEQSQGQVLLSLRELETVEISGFRIINARNRFVIGDY